MTKAIEYLRKYRSMAPDGGDRISDIAINAQAARSDEIVKKFESTNAIVLGDPVGTGKTPVALAAAGCLLSRNKVDHVLVIAPNTTVAAQWRDRALQMGLDSACHTPKKRWKHGSIKVATPATLPGGTIPDRQRLLVVIDEAHRGLQNDSTKRFQALKPFCANPDAPANARVARVLFVTATPLQLSPQGYETMLGLATGTDDNTAALGTSFQEYGRALRAVLAAVNESPTDIVSTADQTIVALAKHAAAIQGAAFAELAEHTLSPFDGTAMCVPPPPRLDPTVVDMPDSWSYAYHAARVVPELLGGVRGASMFTRMLDSSSEAFWASNAGCQLATFASDPANEPIVQFVDQLQARIGTGTDHPKVSATVSWVTDRVATGRHVLLFCFFRSTQNALGAALRSALPQVEVRTPEGSSEVKELHRFRKMTSESNRPMVIVVRDNMSESIDLDGGNPCIVMHDFTWNPVRLRQRFGRVCRISSGFQPVTAADVYVPMLNATYDRRLVKTVIKRADYAEMLIPDIGEQFWALPDDVVDIIRGTNSH